MTTHPKFAIVYEAKGARTHDREDVWMTKPGYKLVLCDGDFGWTSGYIHDNRDYPKQTMLFNTEEDAHAAMRKWTGHPWYHARSLDGAYEIIEVAPVYDYITGYRRKV